MKIYFSLFLIFFSFLGFSQQRGETTGQNQSGRQKVDKTRTVLDDSTKTIYGMNTSKYMLKSNLFSNDSNYHSLDSSLTNFEKVYDDEKNNMAIQSLGNIGTPTIAAINGFALGGGLELAMSCHMRIASTNSKMGLPEVSLGVIPGYGGTQRLASLVGKGRALEMITTAGILSAKDAKEWGLVNHICEEEELICFAEKMASKIKSNSPNAIARAIKSVNAGE